mgnify:FL=1
MISSVTETSTPTRPCQPPFMTRMAMKFSGAKAWTDEQGNPITDETVDNYYWSSGTSRLDRLVLDEYGCVMGKRESWDNALVTDELFPAVAGPTRRSSMDSNEWSYTPAP